MSENARPKKVLPQNALPQNAPPKKPLPRLQVIAQPAFKNRQFNPYNWLLYTHVQGLGATVTEFATRQLLQPAQSTLGGRIWHLHWPDLILKSPNRLQVWLKIRLFLLLMDLARVQGSKIIWTVHNLGSHEQLHPQLEAGFWPAFTRRLDGYFSLTETGMVAAQERFPHLKTLPGFVVPHGHYRRSYPQQVSRQAARQHLGIPPEANVILSFGRIRSYKNVPHLVRTFGQLTDPQTQLWVVGLPDPGMAAELTTLQAETKSDARIHWHLNFVTEAMTPMFFQAADLVVLPYREILNSGGALLALSLNQPILVPHRGSLGELQSRVGEQWVRTYSGELTTTELAAAMDWAQTTPRPKVAPLDAFEWQQIAQQTVAAYEAVLAPPVLRTSPSLHPTFPAIFPE